MVKKERKKRRQKKSRVSDTEVLVEKQEEEKAPVDVATLTTDALIAIFKKKYKKSLVTVGSDHHLRAELVPFGVVQLDELLGGGLPVGRTILMYGEYSTGKTFLSQKLVASMQHLKKSIVYIDVDRSFSPEWWQTTGVNLDELVVLQPKYGEEAFEMAITGIENGVDLVVLDGIDLLISIKIADASMEGYDVGVQAKLITDGMRRALRVNDKTIFLCINHLRAGMGKFSQYSLPGGKAQQDIASIMMWVAKGVTIKDDRQEKRIGMNIKVQLEKDKIHGRRWESTEIPFLFEGGVIDSVSGLIEIAIDNGIITQSGPRYTYGDEKFLGKKNVREYLIANPDAQEDVKKALKEVKDEEK